MSFYEYIPNRYASEKFNLTAQSYSGTGLTPLLEHALGQTNYNRYVVAQDPLCGGKSEGDIDIIVNPDERNPAAMVFRSIGTVRESALPSEMSGAVRSLKAAKLTS